MSTLSGHRIQIFIRHLHDQTVIIKYYIYIYIFSTLFTNLTTIINQIISN